MPDPEDLSESEVVAIVEAVEAGDDRIDVPQELLEDPEAGKPPVPQSLYAQILTMKIGEKIKLALRGNKDARSILIRDTNKLIRRFVLQNPRITDAEVIGVCRNRSADEEVLRKIAETREWVRNYQVRLALVQNPRTPLAIGLRHVATLDERDIRLLARSKNVPEAIGAQCRRLLFTRQRE